MWRDKQGWQPHARGWTHRPSHRQQHAAAARGIPAQVGAYDWVSSVGGDPRTLQTPGKFLDEQDVYSLLVS